MTLIGMKKLQTIMPTQQKEAVLRALTPLGSVEIKDAQAGQELVASGALAAFKQDNAIVAKRNQIQAAIDTLHKYTKIKKALLAPRASYIEQELYDLDMLDKALGKALQIMELNQKLTNIFAEQNQQTVRMAALKPWLDSDIALEADGGKQFFVWRSTCPSAHDSRLIREEVERQLSLIKIDLISSDNENHYWQIIGHKAITEQLAELLKPYSFSQIQFKGEVGQARIAKQNAEDICLDLQKEQEAIIKELDVLKKDLPLLELAFDALNLQMDWQNLSKDFLIGQNTMYWEAWVPSPKEKQVADILASLGCAWQFSEPAPEDDIPTLMQNSAAAAPFAAITELYGMPKAGSVVDPNPFVMFFFVLFFGMMLGDAMYGLILSLATFWAIKKMKPTGTIRNFLIVACSVGVSSILFGALFSSWFGDFPTALGKMLGYDNWAIPPILFNPLEDPISVLFIAIGIGVVNLFIGMGLSAYRMIKEGKTMDAICDIGLWYLIVGGLIATLLGASFGIYIAAAGAAGVLVTGGRKKPTVMGKVMGGLSSLYGITAYLSDILSYSRLMALGLSTGVVAQVMNSMGSLAGDGVVGWILFVVVFVIGQTFNLFIGLLGAFVHSCRLIYVEFFGRFFAAGGRAFRPLYYKNKYVHIKEEK